MFLIWRTVSRFQISVFCGVHVCVVYVAAFGARVDVGLVTVRVVDVSRIRRLLGVLL